MASGVGGTAGMVAMAKLAAAVELAAAVAAMENGVCAGVARSSVGWSVAAAVSDGRVGARPGGNRPQASARMRTRGKKRRMRSILAWADGRSGGVCFHVAVVAVVAFRLNIAKTCGSGCQTKCTNITSERKHARPA